MLRWYKDRSWWIPRDVRETFDYYSQLESYHKRYPRYYGDLNIKQRSSNQITTSEFLNLNIDEETDHARIEVKYIIVPLQKLSFEIVAGYGKGMKSELTFRSDEYVNTDKSTNISERLPATEVSGSIPPLEILSSRQGKDSSEYENMLLYLGLQDVKHLLDEHLEYELGQICPKCRKGHLKPSGKKEVTERFSDNQIVKKTTATTDRLFCDWCGSSFDTTSIQMI